MPSHRTAAHIDPGLQPERTTLSWSRTGLAMVTVSALFLRWMPHYGLSMLTLPAITLLCAIAIILTHRLRTDRGVRGMGHEPGLGGRPGAPLALVTVLHVLGIVGTALVLEAP